ncbi:MAG: WXG100 family type VII secretion target [Bifidobacteriaceae bacterium]|jgi:WXG100 family type VII secretion target|nr:WXG100 family type VII secretion target [Bifidobacteriaceae bacterium]
MAVWGLDIEQVRQLAKDLDQKASDIDNILSTLTSRLSGTQWTGPDSEKFRSDWSGQYTSALKQVSQGLRDAAQRANQNAADQETVSNA